MNRNIAMRLLAAVVGVALMSLCYQLGVWSSKDVSTHSLRSRFSTDPKAGEIMFYTYYINKDGKEVFHGSCYSVVGDTVTRRDYYDGKTQGIEITTHQAQAERRP